MVTIILHYPHCGSQARVTPRAFPQWQTEGSLSCLQPPQPRESNSHCLSRSAPRGPRVAQRDESKQTVEHETVS